MARRCIDVYDSDALSETGNQECGGNNGAAQQITMEIDSSFLLKQPVQRIQYLLNRFVRIAPP